MELHNAIKLRRTIHSFSKAEVSENIVQRAIEMANYAPCHRLTFPWRFTKINTTQRKYLAQLAIELKSERRKVDSRTSDQIYSKILDPSHLIVASQILSNDPKHKLEDYAACSCAIQNLLLSLVNDGVGSKWSTGNIITHKNTYEIVDVDPLLEEIIGFIWIGYGTPPNQILRPSSQSIYRTNDSYDR